MRKLLAIIVVCIATGIVASIVRHPDRRPMPERFREAMNRVRYLTYTDPDFGYTLPYPSFFHRDDMPHYGPGHVQFSYHVLTDIVLECRVVPMKGHADRRHGFVSSGRMSGLDGCQYYAHHVRRGKLWYVLTLYYHADYEVALAGLRHHVRTWEPFGGPKLKGHAYPGTKKPL